MQNYFSKGKNGPAHGAPPAASRAAAASPRLGFAEKSEEHPHKSFGESETKIWSTHLPGDETFGIDRNNALPRSSASEKRFVTRQIPYLFNRDAESKSVICLENMKT